jgi:hypothetical protein
MSKADHWTVTYDKNPDPEILAILTAHKCRFPKGRKSWYGSWYHLDRDVAKLASAEIKAVIDRRKQELVEATAGLEPCTAWPESHTETGRIIRFNDRDTAKEVELPGGRRGWVRTTDIGDDSRFCVYVPADIATAVRLSHALREAIGPEYAAERAKRESFGECYGDDVLQAVLDADDETKVKLSDAERRWQEHCRGGFITNGVTSCST